MYMNFPTMIPKPLIGENTSSSNCLSTLGTNTNLVGLKLNGTFPNSLSTSLIQMNLTTTIWEQLVNLTSFTSYPPLGSAFDDQTNVYFVADVLANLFIVDTTNRTNIAEQFINIQGLPLNGLNYVESSQSLIFLDIVATSPRRIGLLNLDIFNPSGLPNLLLTLKSEEDERLLATLPSVVDNERGKLYFMTFVPKPFSSTTTGSLSFSSIFLYTINIEQVLEPFLVSRTKLSDNIGYISMLAYDQVWDSLITLGGVGALGTPTFMKINATSGEMTPFSLISPSLTTVEATGYTYSSKCHAFIYAYFSASQENSLLVMVDLNENVTTVKEIQVSQEQGVFTGFYLQS
eukprot:CAMPEP_0201545980 /NCGR_PEP_ID=MMETSP0173_2-20130828/2376_1 /ASSEMBLY_ACC=CAM_ASM_000268 /TAXON_ID=218659 /ORGANISM="Vexillifera sp., Strain DIVA3 564/2" /LENGTH=345 /DNA_ID=CAMNT_0047954543 /DNA_START=684 /DNA_END=1721 /DNA_ORIENTATION=+